MLTVFLPDPTQCLVYYNGEEYELIREVGVGDNERAEWYAGFWQKCGKRGRAVLKGVQYKTIENRERPA